MENIKVEQEDRSELNVLLNQASEFQIKFDVYQKAINDVREQAEGKMNEMQKKYNLNGQAFHYDPHAGELVIVEEETENESELAEDSKDLVDV